MFLHIDDLSPLLKVMSNSQSVIATDIQGCPEDIEKAFWQLWQQNRDDLYHCCLRWMGGESY